MSAPVAGSLLAMLADIPDPRGRQGRRFPLAAMLAATICGLLSGATGCAAIAQWIGAQEPNFWHLLGFYRKPPTENCFRQLLARLPAEDLERVVSRWVGQLIDQAGSEAELSAVAIDGKTLCGTLQPHGQSIHLLSLLDHATGGVLGQLRMPNDTNEHKAALLLLKRLSLEGKVITGDAMFCQRDLCEQIVGDGGHYFVTVKDNQPDLKRSIADDFTPGRSPYSERKRQEQLTEHRTTNKGHGRLEKRHLQASTRVVPYLDWPGAQQVCRIERTITRDGKKTSEVVYAITSLPPELADARLLLQLNRGHWSIENKLHWIRDAVMLEDKCRAKKGHSPQNLAALRNLGLTIIRQAGIKAIKAATRQFAYNSTELLKKLRIIN